MKKRLLSMFLCLCMLLTMVPAALAAGTTGTAAPATEDEGETSGNQITASTTTLTTGNYVLEGDVTLTSGALKVEANNKVTLNLNGKKLTNQAGANTIEVAAGGTLTIEGPGTVDNVSHQKAAVNNSGTVVLNGGTYTRSQEKGTSEEESGSNSYYTILNHGTMTINEGVTVNQGADGAGKFSSLIENGWYSGNDNTGGEPSVMTINGGTFSGGLNTIKNDDYGELTIKGGTFSSYAQACLLNWNVATVEGGTFEGTDSTDATILNGHVNDTMDKGQLTILDGTFSGKYILERMTGSGSDGIGSVEIKGGSFTGSSGIVNQEQGQDLGNGTIEISGGTFSHDVGKFCATGYASTKDETSEKYVVDVANSAQVSTDKDESGNVTATVDGNYSGGETSESGGNGSISTDDSGKVTINVSSDDGEETTTGTTAEIMVGSNALTSINKNENVKEVELKTDVGTLTIDKAAWNSMKTVATEGDETANVVIKLEDKSKEGSNPVYEVTATVGEDNAFDGNGLGSVTISVPFSAADADTAKVFCIDRGKLEDMHAKVSSDDNKTLTWSTTHFSSFGVVPYSNSNEPEVFYTQASESDTQAQGGDFSEAASSVGQNGGAIMLNKDVTGSLTVAKEKTVILDLNGHKLTNDANAQDKSHTITNNGTLTITDSSDSKTGTVDNVSHSKGALVNNEGATATLEAGTLTRSAEAGTSAGANGNSWYVVDNSGTLTVNSGAVKNDSGYSSLVRNMGTMTVNGGSFENTFIAIKNDEGGESKRGQLTISGGTVVSKSGDAVQNWSTATITDDAVIKGDVGTWAYKSGDTIFAGTTTVSGGVIEGDVSAGIYGQGTLGENPQSVPDVTISDKAVVNGNVTYNHSGDAADTGIYGDIKINGGTVNGNVCNPADKGKISMTGGTVTGNVVNQNTGEVSISGGMVEGAVTNESETGEITVTGGTFTTADVSDFVSEDAAITITFDPNGGTCAVKTMILTKKDGSAKVETLPIPTRSGQYDFDGWYTASSGGTEVAENETSFNENTTLYAHWNYTGGGGGGGGSVTTKYTLSFDTNGGSAIAKVTKEKGTTVDLGQYVPTREGYTFAGWYSDEALTQKVTSVKLTANTTVYAKWTENAVTPTLPFTDVKSGDWFYEAVQYVYDKGMMTGVSADRFAPASTTTRGMIVTILYRLENEPAVSGGSAFTDVESGAWYADAVAWAAANDIVNGTSATTFAPNSPITREQMATMLYRFAQYKGMDVVTLQEHLTGYPDGDQVSDYAIPAMNWAVGQGLIAGMENGTLVPQGSATRAQVATILMRFCESIG